MGKFVRPTVETQFHIDFSWWQESKQKLRVFLQSHACPECRDRHQVEEMFDWVDPETGEVFQLDTIWHCLYTYCSHQPDFIDDRTPITTAVFRAFIANNNTPLTPNQLHDILQKKSPDLILRTIGGRKVYQGIRPVESSR